MSKQDAVEKVLKEWVYEVVGREGHGTEWHCRQCLQWSNQSRESVEHYRFCPIGWLEDQAAEIERLRGKLAEIPVAIAFYESEGGAIHPRMKQTLLNLAALEGSE